MTATATDRPPTPDAVRAELDAHVRRFVQAHAGDVDVVSVSDAGDVRVRFFGACNGCPAIGSTLAGAVMPAIRALPGVRSVSAEGVNLSTAALERIERLRTAPRRTGGRPAPAAGQRG